MAPCAFGRQRLRHEFLQYLFINISEFLDVEAALSGCVLAEPREQRLSATEPDQAYRTVADFRGEKEMMGMSPSRPLSYL